MRTLTKIVIHWPWLTILIVLGITVFFALQLPNVRIDNEVKNFLPDTQLDKQQFLRTEEIFGSEIIAVIGITVEDDSQYKDVFNPYTLKIVDELTTWLEELEIESPLDNWVWVKPEQVDEIKALSKQYGNQCTPEFKEKLEELEETEEIEKLVKVIACQERTLSSPENVISLATMQVIYDKLVPSAIEEGEFEHQLMIEDVWEDVPSNEEETDRVRKSMDTWELYENNVISPDRKSTAISVFLPEGVLVEYAETLQGLIEEKIAEIDKPDDGLSFEVGGMPMISAWLGKYMHGDLRTLIPFVFFVIIIVLIISFRNGTGVILPLITVTIATIWTVGMTVLTNSALTIITSALPTLIVAVGSAYTIHIMHNFFENIRAGVDTKQAITDTMVKVGLAVVMAGLTTVGGFFSLSSSSVIPVKELGYFASFGTLAALLVSITFVPATLCLLSRSKRITFQVKNPEKGDHDPSKSLLGKILAWVASTILRYKWLVLGGSAALIVVCVALTSNLIMSSNLVEYFVEGSPIRTTDDYLCEQFGGTNTFSVIIKGDEDGYWKNPEPLRKLDELQNFVQKSFPEIGDSLSINEYIKKMNMALHEDDPAEYRIPDTRRAVANNLFLFAQKSDTLESVVDFEYLHTRITFRSRNGHTSQQGIVKKTIDNWMETNWPEMVGKPAPPLPLGRRIIETLGFVSKSSPRIDMKYHYSGVNHLRLIVDRLIVVGQISSIALSIIVVFILAMIIFRSVVGGLLSVVPTVLAVLGNFAIMGAFGIALDVGTALVSAAAVGIGIDYAIHYINRYRVERIAGAKSYEAVRRTHLTSGKAIIFNAVAVALGFFVLLFSNFVPVQRMGLLTGITMFSACFIALSILPILLVLLRPRFIRKVAGDNSNNGGTT